MSVRLSSSLLVSLLIFCDLSVAQTTLTVAAASDLAPLLPELAGAFRKTDPAVEIKWVTGASATLAQQIDHGAPYDAFLSANAQFLDRLASNRKIDPDSVRAYAIGRLAALWKDGKTHSLNDLTQDRVRFVALANPKLAPYGAAAQQSLEHAGLWDRIHRKIVYGENVRQALELFESGNADVVLTSASLLLGKPAQIIADDWHQPIIQKAGVVAASSNQAAAGKFLDWLIGPDGQAVFARFGFGKP